MNSKQWLVQHQKMKHFSFVDRENHPLKVISLAELYSFAESREDIFEQLGIQLSLGENTFHMY